MIKLMKHNDIRSYRTYSNGFTLIELIVAVLIFSIGIVGIMKMHQASVQSNNYAMQLTQAMNILTDRIEFLRGLPFDDANMTTGVGLHAPVTVTSMGLQYTYRWEVESIGSGNIARRVDLTVEWDEKALHHQLPMEVIFAP